MKAGYTRDSSVMKAVLKRLEDAKKLRVKVGVLQSSPKRDDGFDMVALAAVHEYGSRDGRIPERAPLRSALAAQRPRYAALFRKWSKAIIHGKMTGEQAMALLGQLASADVRGYIREGKALPANTPEVFMRKLMKNSKGFDRTGKAPVPLIDTAQLLNAYSYEVYRG